MMRISRIRRYPIKGLAGKGMNSLELSAGAGVPLDRGFALSFGDRLIGLSEEPRLARFSAGVDSRRPPYDLSGRSTGRGRPHRPRRGFGGCPIKRSAGILRER